MASDKMKNEKDNDQVVKDGNTVKVHYTGTFDDGNPFDSSKGKEPLEFTVGASQVIQGFEKGVLGMKIGEEKDIKIKPENGYGLKNDKLIQEVPKERLPQDLEPKENMVLTLKSPDGRTMMARIGKINKDSIVLDMNHPLAGKNLNFKIKLEAIE